MAQENAKYELPRGIEVARKWAVAVTAIVVALSTLVALAVSAVSTVGPPIVLGAVVWVAALASFLHSGRRGFVHPSPVRAFLPVICIVAAVGMLYWSAIDLSLIHI